MMARAAMLSGHYCHLTMPPSIYIALGIIIGLLLNPAKTKIVEKVVEHWFDNPTGKTQFLESVTPQEKFKAAKNIDDLLT